MTQASAEGSASNVRLSRQDAPRRQYLLRQGSRSKEHHGDAVSGSRALTHGGYSRYRS